MSTIDFNSLVGGALASPFADSADWFEWRYCYEGGSAFREEYLYRFSDRETKEEFIRRRNLTPIPSFARLEINRVKNSLARRFPDIIRRGGSAAWQEAMAGDGRGVDRRGTSMNSYLAKYILPESLVMRWVGVLVTAPRVKGDSAADVPQDFRPYLNYYPVESIEKIIPAKVDSSSDWAAVLLREVDRTVDVKTGTVTEGTVYRYLYLDPDRDGRVTIERITEMGEPVEAPIYTNLTEVPFVLVDVGASLMKPVASYQISHLNLMSADTAYAIDANYPFMVRQRGNVATEHLIGAEDEATTGVKKGLFYDKGVNPPAFISPPTEPMSTALAFRKAFREEVRDLVTGTLEGLGEDGTMEAGLAFIGQCLEDAEARMWDHWVAYESADASRRRVPQILYPETWNLKTDAERLEEANQYIDTMNKLPVQEGKKEAAKVAYEILFRGKLKAKDLDNIKKKVDEAPFTTSDAKIIIDAKKEGIVSAETAAMALGFNPDEAEKAKKDQADRAAQVVAAQADAAGGAARGNPDGSVDPNSTAKARAGEAEGADKINPGPGVRGEGQDTNEDEE